MNKTDIYILFVAFLVTFTGCNEKENGPDNITSLQLSVNKNRIVADTSDYAMVTVSDQNGKDVTALVTINFNGNNTFGPRVYCLTPCISTVYAKYNSIKSNEVEIEVIEDKNLKFVKNVIVEQYTGTWCGWCPRAINQINILQKTDKNTVHIAYHLSDEMTYSMNSLLFQSFGFTVIPTVHADRKVVWTGDVGTIASMHPPSRIGISMDVSGNAAKVSAEVKVKFGIMFIDGLKVSAYLVHDSLIANQTNFYNTDPASPFYQKGATMVNFLHRNVMMQAGTNMFGEKIPDSLIDIGSIYTNNFVFTNFRCDDIKKIRIVVLVTYESGKQIDKVINGAIAGVGEKKDFVYSGK